MACTRNIPHAVREKQHPQCFAFASLLRLDSAAATKP
jgi:hypothetical protein